MADPAQRLGKPSRLQKVFLLCHGSFFSGLPMTITPFQSFRVPLWTSDLYRPQGGCRNGIMGTWSKPQEMPSLKLCWSAWIRLAHAATRCPRILDPCIPDSLLRTSMPSGPKPMAWFHGSERRQSTARPSDRSKRQLASRARRHPYGIWFGYQSG